MKYNSILLALAVATCSFLITVNSATAQGTAFTYQGRLNDGGSPAHGAYDFRFKLYADPSGTTQIGASFLTNAIPATNGLFVTPIDFGGGIFNGSNYWLEVDVKTNGAGSYAVLTPLQAVTPAPYAVFANTASNLSGTLPTAQLSGTIANGNLPASPSFSGNVTATGGFAGNGANVTNVNAASLGGLSSLNFWKLGGNNVAAGQFLGSTNNQPLELWVNNSRALRLEPGTSGQGAQNVIGGSQNNFVSSGVVGATVGGGGATNYFGLHYTNSVTQDFGTVSGGGQNTVSGYAAMVGGGVLNTSSGNHAVVGGGQSNQATNWYSTVPGGLNNTAGGQTSFAAGDNAQAIHNGAFVWADFQGTAFSSTKTNQFNVRANGGVRFVTAGAGMTLDGPLSLPDPATIYSGGGSILSAASSGSYTFFA
ncbi:MAG TPA: hypothetical protein DCQ92_15945, partial [Verrucomicrobia subdivision 3 bacterium]|nr:hypothetical protein [Limisphaerales bacterium]